MTSFAASTGLHFLLVLALWSSAPQAKNPDVARVTIVQGQKAPKKAKEAKKKPAVTAKKSTAKAAEKSAPESKDDDFFDNIFDEKADDTDFSGAPHTLARPLAVAKITVDYPKHAQQLGIEGNVVLELKIRSTGTLVDVKVIESVGFGLDEAAIEAVKKFAFTPAKDAEGKAMASVLRHTMKFRL